MRNMEVNFIMDYKLVQPPDCANAWMRRDIPPPHLLQGLKNTLLPGGWSIYENDQWHSSSSRVAGAI